MSYRIAQDFEYLGHDYWKWWAWIDAADADLDAVDRVVWILHPSFSQPRVTVRSRDTAFRMETAGWGTFVLRADVMLKSGEVVAVRRMLRLEYPEVSAGGGSESAEGVLASSRPPSVFLSYSSLESRTAARLRESLTRAGLQVLDQTQLAAGDNIRESLLGMIGRADAVISLIGEDDLSPWVDTELGYAVASEKPTLALLMAEATGAKLPPQVQVERLDPGEFDPGLVTRLVSGATQR